MTAELTRLYGALSRGVSSFGVIFDPDDVAKLFNSLNRVYDRARTWIPDEMQRLCAVKLSQNIYTAIKGGKYAYDPYDSRYQQWKDQFFPGKGFWRLKDDLVKNLRAFSVSKGWAAGVPAGIMDSGGKSWLGDGSGGLHKKEIAMYGSVNERIRPVFKPETESFREEWRDRGKKTLNNIGKGWR
jgi:hypothetical protein